MFAQGSAKSCWNPGESAYRGRVIRQEVFLAPFAAGRRRARQLRRGDLYCAHASGSSAASAWKRCGKVKAEPKGHFKVSKKGSVSCRSARKLMRQFLVQHKGTKHGGPYGYNTYWTLGRWKCGAGAGGGGCTRKPPKARVQGVWTSR